MKTTRCPCYSLKSTRDYLKEFSKGVRQALSLRDKSFGDYREGEKQEQKD